MVKNCIQIKAGLALRGLTPLPGQCFAVPTPASEAQDHGIWIPDSAMRRCAPGFVAEIVAENAVTAPASLATIRGTVARTFAFAAWAGQRFHWYGLDLIRYHLSVEHLLAVYFAGAWLPLLSEGHEMRVKTPEVGGIQRCRYCKSRGQGNMIMSADKCPQCGRNAAGRLSEKYNYQTSTGQHVTLDAPLKISEEDREVFGGTGRSKKARGLVISYPK